MPHARRSMRREEFHSQACRHGAVFTVLARRLTGQEADAQDVLQSALTKAWQRYARGEKIENFRAWVIRFLLHESRNAHRRAVWRNDRESPRVEDAVEPRPSFIDAVDAVAVLQRELGHESFHRNPLALVEHLDQRLSTALMSLSTAERTAFLLRSVAELDYRQIAGVCAVPVGTVMSRIFRAREKLRLQLGKSSSEHRNEAALDRSPKEHSP